MVDGLRAVMLAAFLRRILAPAEASDPSCLI
jgi:hypothetical protein